MYEERRPSEKRSRCSFCTKARTSPAPHRTKINLVGFHLLQYLFIYQLHQVDPATIITTIIRSNIKCDWHLMHPLLTICGRSLLARPECPLQTSSDYMAVPSVIFQHCSCFFNWSSEYVAFCCRCWLFILLPFDLAAATRPHNAWSFSLFEFCHCWICIFAEFLQLVRNCRFLSFVIENI